MLHLLGIPKKNIQNLLGTRLFLVPFQSCFVARSDCSISAAVAEVCNSLLLQTKMELPVSILWSNLVSKVQGQSKPAEHQETACCTYPRLSPLPLLFLFLDM